MNEIERRIARGIFDHVLSIAALICAGREHLAKERDEGRPRDATALAGHLAQAILDAGGGLADGNAHRLRWHFEEEPEPRNDPDGLEAARKLFGQVLDCLKSSGIQRATLERVAALWPTMATKGELDVAERRAMPTMPAPAPAPTTPPPPSAKPAADIGQHVEMPLVERQTAPEGRWKPDGTYAIDEFVRQPTVG